MKTNEEFEALTGTPKRAGKSDPNSMTNRILKVIPTDGAVSHKELVTKVTKANKKDGFTEPNEKQIKTLISNLTNKKDKNGQVKVEVKHELDHEPFYRRFAEGG